jgi:5-methylcytosine-specific restriction endonuclease McrA
VTPDELIARSRWETGHVDGRTITQRRRKRVFNRDGNKCLQCGRTWGLTLDHIIPRSRGGTNRQNNLQTLCHPCNQRKADTL